MNVRLALLSSALLTAAVTTAVGQPVLRLAIVDDSGSMSGEKIALVRTEIAAILRSNPPTTAQPFALITFGSSPSVVQVFTDMQPAVAAINKLSGSAGGTDIAAGLRQGLAALQQLGGGKNAVVLLFTDGEDSNTVGIREAEAKLDALFMQRRKQGLNQAVYLKQWGAGGADQFAKRLAESGSADLINGDSVTVLPVAVRPVVNIEDVQRLDDQHTLQVRWAVVLECDVRPASQPRVRVQCVDASAKGATEAIALLGDLSPPNTMTVTSTASLDTHSEFRLPFKAALVPHTGPALVIQPCFVRPDQFEIPVSLPEIRIRNEITAVLEMTEVPRWTDPLALRVRYPVRLKFHVKATDPTQNIDRSCSLRITPAPGCFLSEGKEVFTLPGPGDYELPLAFELLPSRSDVARADLRYSLKFTIQPINLPPYLTFVPPEIEFHDPNLRAPDAVLIPVTATTDRVWTPQWFRLPNVATTLVDLRVHLPGPVPANTRLHVAAQKAVWRVDLRPETLRSGENKVRLRLVSDLQPSPAKTNIRLELKPIHDGTSGVEFRGTPLLLSLSGPAPVRLVHVDDRGRPATSINAVASDLQTEVTLVIRPTIVGLGQSESAGNVAARLRAATGQLSVPKDSLPLNQATSLTLPLPNQRKRSWIWDEIQNIPIWLEPASPTPSVVPVSLEVSVLREAPIRRVALQLSIALSLFVVAILAIRTVLRLRNRAECTSAFSASDEESWPPLQLDNSPFADNHDVRNHQSSAI